MATDRNCRERRERRFEPHPRRDPRTVRVVRGGRLRAGAASLLPRPASNEGDVPGIEPDTGEDRARDDEARVARDEAPALADGEGEPGEAPAGPEGIRVDLK